MINFGTFAVPTSIHSFFLIELIEPVSTLLIAFTHEQPPLAIFIENIPFVISHHTHPSVYTDSAAGG